MDLKSMLNDSSAQRPPRLQTHTSQSSYDHTPQSESHSKRPSPYPPPLQPVDSRAQSAGGYFGIQSPHQNNLNSASTHASTPSAGTHSAYARSPGTHIQSYAPRDGPNALTHPGTSFVRSPSMSVHQPPTPGTAQQYQIHTPGSAHSQIGPPPPFSHSQSPRGSIGPGGPINPQSRQISPVAQFLHQPATPLGPPSAYSKVSPSAQRPMSQGYDQHYRRTSHGSVSSSQSREYSHSVQQQSESMRAASVQRQQSISEIDRLGDRERSVSVSPKTIPQPSPYQNMSSAGTPASQRNSIQSTSGAKQTSAPPPEPEIKTEVKSEPYSTPTPKASVTSTDNAPFSRGPSMGAVPAYPSNPQQASTATSSPISVHKSSPAGMQHPSLKRNASHLSDANAPTEQPRKRLRRQDIPIFAQTARKRIPKFGDNSRVKQVIHTATGPKQPPPKSMSAALSNNANDLGSQQRVQKAASDAIPNGHPSAHSTPVPEVNLNDHKWEPTIANETPREDLSFAVANWIYRAIGQEQPLLGGAMFEIEAKIGEILDVEQGARLKIPAMTETVFMKDMWGRTKFESSMNMEQHRLLNQYLNKLTQDACQTPGREMIAFEHLREYDDFYELSEEGIKNLHPSIKQWLKPRQAPRVRKTVDKVTGQVKAMIIKSRITDMEIYNPGYDFDYRISISIESPWSGDVAWLRPMREGEGKTRLKDRMSYRHLTNQIDLTQVSHEDTAKMEHELEVEMSMTQLYTELQKLRSQAPSRFEDLVRSLLDNTRLLCREGSLKKQ